jgi:hypothetical protein
MRKYAAKPLKDYQASWGSQNPKRQPPGARSLVYTRS